MSEQELHALVVELVKKRKKREGIEGEEAAAWKRVYEIATDTVGEDVAYRWLDVQAEQVIGRSIAVSDRLDVVKLREFLTPEEWELVTVQPPTPERYLDVDLLEAAVVSKKIKKETVAEATSETRTARKLLSKPNKEERAVIAAAKKAS